MTDGSDGGVLLLLQVQTWTNGLSSVCSNKTNLVCYKASRVKPTFYSSGLYLPSSPSFYLITFPAPICLYSTMLSHTRTALCALFSLALVSHSILAFNPLASTNVVNYWGQKYVVFPFPFITPCSLIWPVTHQCVDNTYSPPQTLILQLCFIHWRQ